MRRKDLEARPRSAKVVKRSKLASEVLILAKLSPIGLLRMIGSG